MTSFVSRLGRLVVSPLVGAASWYNRTALAYPVMTGVVTTGLKTSAADVFAQKIMEKREDFDWRRHSIFCLFGFAYLGGFQYWLYNKKFVQWCGPITELVGHRGVAPVKTLMDQCIHHPFVYFPVFYSLKAMVEGNPLSDAFHKYRSELVDNVKALWTIWIPAQLFNFAFVPRHLRIPYVAGVSFVWTVVLSVMQGRFDSLKEQTQRERQLEAVREVLPTSGLLLDSGEGSANHISGHSIPPLVMASIAEIPMKKGKTEDN